MVEELLDQAKCINLKFDWQENNNLQALESTNALSLAYILEYSEQEEKN